MSTGADCQFREIQPGMWYYRLQQFPYGDCEEYHQFGPSGTFREALNHLNSHHANPGGFSVSALAGCPHDLLRGSGFDPDAHNCDRCSAVVYPTPKSPITPPTSQTNTQDRGKSEALIGAKEACMPKPTPLDLTYLDVAAQQRAKKSDWLTSVEALHQVLDQARISRGDQRGAYTLFFRIKLLVAERDAAQTALARAMQQQKSRKHPAAPRATRGKK